MYSTSGMAMVDMMLRGGDGSAAVILFKETVLCAERRRL